ncbi:hypothetical protein [Streptomyces longisporoflavus]|uniref:Integral membrane protein n=1 Tax=Streptomyces longisporoflavus TaxID=28044 RepID=A0ABW7R528_9ACTN
MSAAGAPRTARFYTAARRHPWVVGKLADWRLPLGPYNAAQIALAVIGGFVLIKTISVWSVLGPVPVTLWLVGIWLLRRPKIGGRHPVSAALGMVALLVQPAGGRIGPRAARDPRARRLGGGFTLEPLTPAPSPGPVAAAASPAPAPARAKPTPARATPSQHARRATHTPKPAGPTRPTGPTGPTGAAAGVSPAAALLARAHHRAQTQKAGV